MNLLPLWVDTETYSDLDIRAVGTARYTEHCELMVVTWALGDEPVRTWDLLSPKAPDMREELRAAVARASRLIAQNAIFDRRVLTRHLDFIPRDPDRWDCLMARSARAGWTKFGLAYMGVAVGLQTYEVKKTEGKRLIRMFCVPRRPTKNIPQARYLPEHKPQEWRDFLSYAQQDVVALRAIWQRLPGVNDTVEERDCWVLDQHINDRGWPVDRQAVDNACRIIDAGTDAITRELTRITAGEVTSVSQIARIRAFLADRGVKTQKLDATAVTELLKRVPDSAARRVLELRREGARATNHKYTALAHALSDDDRLRGSFQYGGAARTMRWSGRKFQPQNLIRPPKNFPAELIAGALRAGLDWETLSRISARPPFELLAYGIRGVIRASKGMRLVLGDLSQIEARLVCWLAGHQEMLDVFADPDTDPYVHTAQRIGSTNRQLGKVLVLACGYGMGGDKFTDTANAAGVEVDLEQGGKYVKAWRSANQPIVSFWYSLEEAALAALREPGTFFGCRRLRLLYEPLADVPYLGIQLPSGRWLLYPHARVDVTGQIVYAGRGFDVRAYGGQLVENVVQATARDVLVRAMLAADKQGFHIVGHVHDEIVTEQAVDDADHGPEELHRLMVETPSWAKDLPLAAECRASERYGK